MEISQRFRKVVSTSVVGSPREVVLGEGKKVEFTRLPKDRFKYTLKFRNLGYERSVMVSETSEDNLVQTMVELWSGDS